MSISKKSGTTRRELRDSPLAVVGAESAQGVITVELAVQALAESPIPTLLLDLQGNIAYLNDAARDLIECPRDDAPPQPAASTPPYGASH